MKSAKLITIMMTAMLLSLAETGWTIEPVTLKTKFQYAVKFVCGRPTHAVGAADETQPVTRGRFATAINVHNPFGQDVTFAKKVAIALPGQQAGAVSNFVLARLGKDEAFEVDCPDIRSIANKTDLTTDPFLKGFVVIRTFTELDIWAVYTMTRVVDINDTTTDNAGVGVSIDVEEVKPRKLTATATVGP